MTYKLKFFESAHKEWQKLDPHVQKQFKEQLKKRLENPHVASAKLRGYPNLYKIKIHGSQARHHPIHLKAMHGCHEVKDEGRFPTFYKAFL